jgi:hypothetical protein
MNGQVVNYRVEGAKYGISFGTALAIAISSQVQLAGTVR